MAIRERLPFPLFVVLVAVVIVLGGFVCICFSDHPEQALDRVLAVSEVPAPLSHAALLMLTAILAAPLVVATRPGRARLQSFRL